MKSLNKDSFPTLSLLSRAYWSGLYRQITRATPLPQLRQSVTRKDQGPDNPTKTHRGGLEPPTT